MKQTTFKTGTIFNGQAIVSIKVTDKKECDDLTYIKERVLNNWWRRKPKLIPGAFVVTISHIFDSSGARRFTPLEIEYGAYHNIHFLVENNIAYFKPNVQVKFTNGSEYNVEFDTYELAWAYAEKVAKENDIKYQIII